MLFRRTDVELWTVIPVCFHGGDKGGEELDIDRGVQNKLSSSSLLSDGGRLPTVLGGPILPPAASKPGEDGGSETSEATSMTAPPPPQPPSNTDEGNAVGTHLSALRRLFIPPRRHVRLVDVVARRFPSAIAATGGRAGGNGCPAVTRGVQVLTAAPPRHCCYRGDLSGIDVKNEISHLSHATDTTNAISHATFVINAISHATNAINTAHMQKNNITYHCLTV